MLTVTTRVKEDMILKGICKIGIILTAVLTVVLMFNTQEACKTIKKRHKRMMISKQALKYVKYIDCYRG